MLQKEHKCDTLLLFFLSIYNLLTSILSKRLNFSIYLERTTPVGIFGLERASSYAKLAAAATARSEVGSLELAIVTLKLW